MEKNAHHKLASLSRRTAANRRNAQLSTGPKTEEGNSRSRRNALKHGILASALLITQGEGAEDRAEFDELLGGLHRDLAPVGTLEEMLVEKIAVCWWRQKRALRCEAGLVRREFCTRSRPSTGGISEPQNRTWTKSGTSSNQGSPQFAFGY